MPQQKPGKQEARCPMCGSELGNSPAGQQILQKASQAMAQKAKGGQQPQRPGMPQGGPQGRPGMDPRQALMQRMQQAQQMRGR